MLKKRMRLARTNAVTTVDLDAVWTYDNEGRMTSVAYPMGPAYNYEYDLAGRLNKMKLGETEHVNNVQYGAAGQLLQMAMYDAGQNLYETETRGYNNRLQLTRVTMAGIPYPWTTTMDIEYRYSATQNDGKVTQMKNWISGEEVTYQYDSLQRLASAVTTGPEWGLSFSYDGFGNRTAQTVTKGSAPVANLSYDVATNRIITAGFGYDANGNVTAMPGGRSQSYDVENRLVSASGQSYGYGPNNKRVMLTTGFEQEEVWFWAGNRTKVLFCRPKKRRSPPIPLDSGPLSELLM